MTLHGTTFEHLKPTDAQVEKMERIRKAYAQFTALLDRELPDGPDKTFIMRELRTNAMWANVTIMRNNDGSPRSC